MLYTRRSAIVAASLLVAFGVLLRLEGRVSWCKYGFGLWSAAWSHCTSQNLLDPYTLSLVLHGVIFFWLLWRLANRLALHWRLIAAMVVEIGWELLENSSWVIDRYRQNTASLDYAGDSILNSLIDVVAAIAGFALASRAGWRTSVAVFVVFELIALGLARDNLTLNALMLLWPIEAIKAWQVAT